MTATEPITFPHQTGVAVATLPAAFQQTVTVRPDAVALRTVGSIEEITWAQYARRVEAIAGGLAALGVSRGDTVGIMLTNRPEFHLVDTAALHLGAIPSRSTTRVRPSRSSTCSAMPPTRWSSPSRCSCP